MTKLDIAKKVIKEHIKDAPCGIFNCRNIVGDEMETLYSHEGLQIDICYGYAYYEVFGLSCEDFDKLVSFYKRIGGF